MLLWGLGGQAQVIEAEAPFQSLISRCKGSEDCLLASPRWSRGGGVPGPGESGERRCHLLSLPHSVCPAAALLKFSLIFKYCSVQKGKLIHTKVESRSSPCVLNAWDEKLFQTPGAPGTSSLGCWERKLHPVPALHLCLPYDKVLGSGL